MKSTIKLTAISFVLASSFCFASNATTHRIKVTVDSPDHALENTFAYSSGMELEHNHERISTSSKFSSYFSGVEAEPYYKMEDNMAYIGYFRSQDNDWSSTDPSKALPWFCFGGTFCEKDSASLPFGAVINELKYIVSRNKETMDIHIIVSELSSFEQDFPGLETAIKKTKRVTSKNILFKYSSFSDEKQCQSIDGTKVCLTHS